VPQGVKVHVIELGCLHGVLVQGADTATAEDTPLGLRCQGHQGAVGVAVQWHFAALAVLGQFQS
jgi:hypothetical protein